MRIATLNILFGAFVGCVLFGCTCYLFALIIKALKTYINLKQVHEEKAQLAKFLGEVLKAHRTNCKMTQEFVAERLGVNR